MNATICFALTIALLFAVSAYAQDRLWTGEGKEEPSTERNVQGGKESKE